jgi:hypothetical protein
MDKEIEETIKKQLDSSIIGKEDEEDLRVILTWLKHGRKAADNVNKETVKKLIENGFADEEFMLTNPDDMDTWLMVALLGAKGLMKQG